MMKELELYDIKNPKNHPFFSQLTLQNDQWAAGQGLSEEERKKLGWGLGWGLEKNKNSDVVKAFHSGDMDEWRAFVAIDIENKSGIVYFANSMHGLVLADDIISTNIQLDLGLKYIFEKFGFARHIENDWQKKQIDRICKIITRFELDLADLEAKSLLKIEDNKALHRLTIQNNNPILTITFKKEFDDFVEKNPNALYSFEETKDKEGNVIALEMSIHDDELYNQFIEKLCSDNLLPDNDNNNCKTETAYKNINR